MLCSSIYLLGLLPYKYLLIQCSSDSYYLSYFQIRRWFREGNFRVLSVKHGLIERIQIGIQIFLTFLFYALCYIVLKGYYFQMIHVSSKKELCGINGLEVTLGNKSPQFILPLHEGCPCVGGWQEGSLLSDCEKLCGKATD